MGLRVRMSFDGGVVLEVWVWIQGGVNMLLRCFDLL